MKQVVTIKDVAEKAGVVKSTVSNVLTGRKFVSEELKKKVLDACRELNFHPNFYASGLSSRKSNIIALMLESNDEVERPFYSDLIISCLKEASLNDYSLLVYYSSDNDKLLNTLRQGMAPIDGAILMSPCVNDERMKQIESERIDCVVIGRPESLDISYVDIDNVKLVKDACEALLPRGKDIYLLNSNFNLTISQDRSKSFSEVCKAHGIDVTTHLFESKSSSEEDGYAFSSRVMKKSDIFITADASLAKGVYRAAAEKGFNVGEDIAVFALGRSQEHGTFSPKLSYARQDYSALGKTAVKLLLDEIENGHKVNSVLLESGLVFTQSVKNFSNND